MMIPTRPILCPHPPPQPVMQLPPPYVHLVPPYLPPPVLVPRKMMMMMHHPCSTSGQQRGGLRMKSVWANNLDKEMENLRRVIRTGLPLVATVDTEFPGTVVSSSSQDYFSLDTDGRYALVKSNVDRLKLIQLGLTFSHPTGLLPDLTWEFNFADFDPACDPQHPDSITLLRNHGIDLEMNHRLGIDSAYFARLLLASGLLGDCPNITWVTFSGSYDFAYLIKLLTRQELPQTVEGFSNQLRFYFGHRVYDIKNLIKKYCGLKGGLDKVASQLNVARAAGNSHQAGSDSLLTAHAYRKLRQMLMLKVGWEQQDGGILCGLQVA